MQAFWLHSLLFFFFLKGGGGFSGFNRETCEIGNQSATLWNTEMQSRVSLVDGQAWLKTPSAGQELAPGCHLLVSFGTAGRAAECASTCSLEMTFPQQIGFFFSCLPFCSDPPQHPTNKAVFHIFVEFPLSSFSFF